VKRRAREKLPMRELQVCEPMRRESQAVEWLAFDSTGGELVALADGSLWVYDLRTDFAGPLFGEDFLCSWVGDEFVTAFALSPDCRLLALGGDFEDIGFTNFVEPPGHDYQLPGINTDSGCVGLMFTPDGKELVAVLNGWNDSFEPGVARLALDPILAPKRFVQKQNPLNAKFYKAPAHEPKWKRVMTLPADEPMTAAALSANGRLVAAGTEGGSVHVADLKRKKVLASFDWEGRKLRDRTVRRVGLDPEGKWVASIAGGRLFARPLGEGKAWRTKDVLGRVTDFAYHPDGRVLCAVFEDGQARFLDPRTGTVRQSFKWAKRPKPLHSVAFAPDGLTCAVGSENGKVIVWDVDA
jgi:WD40 repeat protein